MLGEESRNGLAFFLPIPDNKSREVADSNDVHTDQI
jgi:hypothetical protein